MLAIVTAFRSRLLANDWHYHVWLLERALDFILSQTNESFVVAVVCHERPKLSRGSHPKVHFLPVDFAPPQRDSDDMCVDKVLKLSVGVEWALSKGCDYIMFTDADDLVNRRVSEFVATRGDEIGWYTPYEFFYSYGSRWVRKYTLGEMASGPCVIVKSSVAKFATVPFTGRWLDIIIAGGEARYVELLSGRNRRVNTLAAVGHMNFRRLMAAEGDALLPLPFAGNVVINHFDSMSWVPGGAGSRLSTKPVTSGTLRGQLGRLKRAGMLLPSIRPLTRGLSTEFTVPAPTTIPKAYGSAGSVFV